MASAGTASAQAGYTVQVGYMDTLHAATTHLPVPWPNPHTETPIAGGDIDNGGKLLFYGCDPVTCGPPSSSTGYDGGAVRIANNSTVQALQLQSVTINYGPCLYDIWPHSLTVPAGGSLILTENTGGGGNGCTPSTGQMDSSDIGTNPPAYQNAGNCSGNDGLIPTINVTDSTGTVTHYQDRGQILNTGGVDFAACPGGGGNFNEALNWVNIGNTTSCGTGSVTTAPAAQTLAVGNSVKVTADVTNACGQPLTGVPVTFSVTGANPVSNITANTNASGKATISYTGTSTGNDNIFASVTNQAGTFNSNTVQVTWTPSSTPVAAVVVTCQQLPAVLGPVLCTATVTGNGATPQGTVTISNVNHHNGTVHHCTATLTGGVGSCSLTESTAATYSVKATYNPSGTYSSVTSYPIVVSGGAESGGTASTGTPALNVTASGSTTPGDTVTEGQYGNNPVNGLTDGTNYFDVAVSGNNSFARAVITDCEPGVTATTGLDWYDQSTGAWEAVAGDPGPIFDPATGCLTVVIDANSTPNLSQLNGTVFGTTVGDAITSDPSTVVVAGQHVKFIVTTTGTPPPVIAKTGTLPKGLSFKDNGNGTATLSGTAPATSSSATYNITIKAVYFVGPTTKTVKQPFTLIDTSGN
jgi:hypothetical protein